MRTDLRIESGIGELTQRLEQMGTQESNRPHREDVGSSDGMNFSDLLTRSLEEVNRSQTQADTAVKELISGRTKNVHETLLAIEKADSSLRMMMQVRNKVLDAYREIMRMQV